MYCRVYDQSSNSYYRSIVYGIFNAGCFEEHIVLNPKRSCFELVSYFQHGDSPLNPQIHTIQPDRSGWQKLEGAYLLPLSAYLKQCGIAYRLTQLAGFPEICGSHAFLAALLEKRSVPLAEANVPLHELPDADQWQYFTNQADADAFMQDFAGFHDSTLDKFVYEEDTCMSRITATFDNSGWYGVVEICFEGIQMMNLRPPQENYDRFIYDGTLRITEESVLWADDACEDEKNCTCSFIKALSAKWRKI